MKGYVNFDKTNGSSMSEPNRYDLDGIAFNED